VKGFEGGLGYDFDEDTRFAIFDLVTTSNVDTDVLLTGAQTITLTAYPPTSVSCTVTIAYVNDETLTLTAYPPTTVEISLVDAVSDELTFQWWEFDPADAQTTTITVTIDINGVVTPSYCTMTIIPTWVMVTRGGIVLSSGALIYDGDILSVYPVAENHTGGVLDNNITLVDTKTNIKQIRLIHLTE